MKLSDNIPEIGDWTFTRCYKLKSINDDLAKNITNVGKKLQSDLDAARQKYYDAVAARRDELMSAYDLFSEFTSESQTGEQLLFNLQSQAAAIVQ